jgi:hypothetical protein
MNIKNKGRAYDHPSELVEAALAAIVMDVQINDLTAIEELLTFIHPDILKGYLTEPEVAA